MAKAKGSSQPRSPRLYVVPIAENVVLSPEAALRVSRGLRDAKLRDIGIPKTPYDKALVDFIRGLFGGPTIGSNGRPPLALVRNQSVRSHER